MAEGGRVVDRALVVRLPGILLVDSVQRVVRNLFRASIGLCVDEAPERGGGLLCSSCLSNAKQPEIPT